MSRSHTAFGVPGHSYDFGSGGGLQLLALRDWGKPDRPLQPGPPMRPAQRPGTSTPPELLYFEEPCECLKDITIRDDEAAFAHQLEDVGVTLTDGFQAGHLEPATVAGLHHAVPDAQSLLEHKARRIAPVQPGGTWQVSQDLTSLDDWLLRGAVGWKHVWGDLSTEIIFPMARTDAEDNPLTGTNADDATGRGQGEVVGHRVLGAGHRRLRAAAIGRRCRVFPSSASRSAVSFSP